MSEKELGNFKNISSEDTRDLKGQAFAFGDVQEILNKNTKSQQKFNDKQAVKNSKWKYYQQEEVLDKLSVVTDEKQQIISLVVDQTSSKRPASCKAKPQIVQRLQQDIYCDINQPNDIHDDEYKSVEEYKGNGSQIEKKTSKFKVPFQKMPVTNDELETIFAISNNFTEQFRNLGLRNHQKFKSLSSSKFEMIRTWYQNVRRSHIKIDIKNIEIKNVEYPNELLMNAIRNGDIPEQYLPIFAEAVEKYLEAQYPHILVFN